MLSFRSQANCVCRPLLTLIFLAMLLPLRPVLAQDEVTLQFDALTRRFTSSKDVGRKLRPNKPFNVEIVNVNTWREEYGITFEQLEFHTSKMPNEFGSIFNVSESSLAATDSASRASMLNQAQRQIGAAVVPEKSNASPLLRELLSAFAAFRTTSGEVLTFVRVAENYRDMDNRFAFTITASPTNIRIRKNSTRVLREYFNAVLRKPDGTKAFSFHSSTLVDETNLLNGPGFQDLDSVTDFVETNLLEALASRIRQPVVEATDAMNSARSELDRQRTVLDNRLDALNELKASVDEAVKLRDALKQADSAAFQGGVDQAYQAFQTRSTTARPALLSSGLVSMDRSGVLSSPIAELKLAYSFWTILTTQANLFASAAANRQTLVDTLDKFISSAATPLQLATEAQGVAEGLIEVADETTLATVALLDDLQKPLARAELIYGKVVNKNLTPGTIQQTLTRYDADAVVVKVTITPSEKSIAQILKEVDAAEAQVRANAAFSGSALRINGRQGFNINPTPAPKSPAPQPAPIAPFGPPPPPEGESATPQPPVVNNNVTITNNSPTTSKLQAVEKEEQPETVANPPADPPKVDKPKPQEFYFEAPVFGRMVLDFSGGVIVSALKQRDYFVGPANGSSATDPGPNVIREGVSDSPGTATAGVFAHYYNTSQLDINLPILGKPSFGLSIGTTQGGNLGTRFLLGGTVIFGRMNRIMITSGLDFGKVNMLSGDRVGQPPRNGSTREVREVWRSAPFIGLSFSFNLNLSRRGSGTVSRPPDAKANP